MLTYLLRSGSKKACLWPGGETRDLFSLVRQTAPLRRNSMWLCVQFSYCKKFIYNKNTPSYLLGWEGNTGMCGAAVNQHVGLTKFVDKGGRIIPDAAVESRWMVSQLVQNLLHLKRCQDIFNEHRRLDAAQWQAELDTGTDVRARTHTHTHTHDICSYWHSLAVAWSVRIRGQHKMSFWTPQTGEGGI